MQEACRALVFAGCCRGILVWVRVRIRVRVGVRVRTGARAHQGGLTAGGWRPQHRSHLHQAYR